MDSKVCFQRFDRHGVDFVPTVHQYRNQYLSIFDIALFDHADEGGDDDDDDDGDFGHNWESFKDCQHQNTLIFP